MLATVSGHRAKLYFKRQQLLELGVDAEAFLTEIVHRHPRTWRGEVYRMRFAVSAPGRATRFVVGTPKRRATLDLGAIGQKLPPSYCETLTHAVVQRARDHGTPVLILPVGRTVSGSAAAELGRVGQLLAAGAHGLVLTTETQHSAGAQEAGWSVSASFTDYDRDGWLDLFIGNYADYSLDKDRKCYAPNSARDYCSPKMYPALPDRLANLA